MMDCENVVEEVRKVQPFNAQSCQNGNVE